MKIFQIGFNFGDIEFLNRFCVDHGWKCIRWDHGKLAQSIHDNFTSGKPLLSGYESYDFYADMENVDLGLECYVEYCAELDKQYPNSKFILNTGDMEEWIQKRLAHESYLQRAMSASQCTSKDEMVRLWETQWKTHHQNVRNHFKGREGSHLLEFRCHRDHPMSLYVFLNPVNSVYEHFEKIYTTRFHSRIHSYSKTKSSSLEKVDIYCPFLPQRECYITNMLKRFHCVNYVDAITPDDLHRKDYQRLSTTLMVGPMITYCHLCNHCREHQDIFNKFTKLCVHLSYLVCMRHAMQHSSKEFVLIFEDDIYFDVPDQVFDNHILEFSRSSYDLAYLGFCACRQGDVLIEKFEDKTSLFIPLPYNQTIRCKHAIIFRLSYIRRVLGELLPLMYNSDIEFNHANIRLRAKVAMARNPIVFQDRVRLGSHNDNHPTTPDQEKLPLY